MNILILGASGFIGKNLLMKLKNKNNDLTVCLRNRRLYSESKLFNNVNIIQKDILEFTKQDVVKYDVIYYLVGALGGFNMSYNELYRVNVELINHVIGQCDEQKFIFVSSCGVLGPGVNKNEDSKLRPSNSYEKTKMIAEEIVRRYNNHVIIRPEFVYGPGDKHVLNLFRSIYDGKFALISGGKSLLHPTYIDDVVTCLIRAMDHRNETFNVAGERAVSVRELVSIIDKKANCINVSKFVIYPVAIFSEMFSKIFPFNPLVTVDRVKFFTQSRSVDIRKSKKMLRFKPTPIKKGISMTLAHYKKEGLL